MFFLFCSRLFVPLRTKRNMNNSNNTLFPMKKLMLCLLAMLLAIPSTAQIYRDYEPKRYDRSNDREHYYGLRLGLNVASISSGDVMLDADSYSGLYLGGVYGMQLSRQAPIWLEVGLAYSEKGGVSRSKSDDKVKYRMSYLQMPVVCKYNIDLEDFHIQPFFGGYLAVGIAGQTKDYTPPRQSYSTYDTFNRFDGGLRLGCGAEYQMLYLEVGFDFGLSNISKDDFDTAHSRCFFLTAGVNF